MIDRKKDIFKYAGHHINPSELENIIQDMDGVEFAAVVGIPNAATYNLTAAVVKKKAGYEKLTEDEIVQAVAKQLPIYKQLHGGVYFVDELPTTATSKFIKKQIKEIAIERFTSKQTS